MKKHTLHEIAKLLSGMVLEKILFLCWASTAGLFPITAWGITWNNSMVFPAIAFNSALFWILVHYGWHVGKIPTVREKSYLAITGGIFAIVALLHLIRLFFGGLDFILFGWAIPLWFSWIGAVFAGFLSYMSFKFRKHL